MNRTIVPWIAASALALALAGCTVEQTEPGRAPDVDVKVEPGKMPAYDVKPVDVDVNTTTRTISVPDVDVNVNKEQRTITVPEVNVSTPQ